MADVSLVFGPLICDFGQVVVISDVSVWIFSFGFGVVSGEPLLGRDGWWLSWQVRLAGCELGGGAFGGGPGFGGVAVPGCARLVGFG